MSYIATVLEVMIASPSDVKAERDVARQVFAEWNATHSRESSRAILPIAWDTHLAPDLAGRPQQIINDRVASRADILIGVFWTRLGSPTGKAASGTVEEIKNHMQAGKPVMLYFSNQPVAPESLDRTQYEDLLEFRSWANGQGITATYSTPEQFQRRLASDLRQILVQNPYILSLSQLSAGKIQPPDALSADAREVLKRVAGQDEGNYVIMASQLGFTSVQTGDHVFNADESGRESARWRAAVAELDDAGFLHDVSKDGTIFELTDRAYKHLDKEATG